jgi:hypothetical protein
VPAGLSAYSRLDRLVHRIAFAAPAVQLAAADIEKTAYKTRYETASPDRPIFITSLPRAGTTVLLTALSRLPGMATHLYRDMPFVMAPILWSTISGAFRKPAKIAERAHRDGIQIGYDSPEAFEEIVWRTFWPDKYASGQIGLWTENDRNAEGEAFLRDHMRKIIALRCPDQMAQGRYLSKNNSNIAKLDLILAVFPAGEILVPLRWPLDHAASLLSQHLNFLKQHSEDDFTRRYMGDIGHYEFGALHRPIWFPGLEDLLKGRDKRTLDYWLAYWVAAFEHVRARRHKVRIVPYEALCADGPAVFRDLCGQIVVEDLQAVARAGEIFHPRETKRAVSRKDVDEDLRLRSQTLYVDLGGI